MAEFSCFLNDFQLKRPPLVTLQVEDTAFANNVFVLINRYLQQLSEPDAEDFDQTAALIGRLMARRKNSFRNMPGFRSVCKLNTALCRLLRLDLPRELEHFRGVVCDGELAGAMPTRSNFEYILVRLLGFYHLHARIRECCVSAARYFIQLLRNNYFMETLTLLLAAIAKINKLSKLQANRSASLYNKLRPHCVNFPQVENHKFLPENCQLPAQLQRVQLQAEASAPEAPESVLLKPPTIVTKAEKARLEAKADVGTVLARKERPAKMEFNMDTLRTVKDVKRFIGRETKARDKKPTSCITRDIYKHDWMSAQTLFYRRANKDPEKALNIFRKFIVSKL
ncbi:uncharacterized protein LOC117589375 [Drosophila guanche]|uniref:Nucleolus and neural progenitor protein-like N-terminal domain-containing protein n=1 Tax=Drosophila guanche TaxID=7266 RepID=A0A3B0K443_DROGU|nr:uncharacterized protein LOC117589375 [Drosophila guanche]SPP87472.1 Hypothetical predicted protein [Drosophila guanche]